MPNPITIEIVEHIHKLHEIINSFNTEAKSDLSSDKLGYVLLEEHQESDDDEEEDRMNVDRHTATQVLIPDAFRVVLPTDFYKMKAQNILFDPSSY